MKVGIIPLFLRMAAPAAEDSFTLFSQQRGVMEVKYYPSRTFLGCNFNPKHFPSFENWWVFSLLNYRITLL